MNSGAPFLSRLSLFADLSSETLARLEHRLRRRDFAPRPAMMAPLADRLGGKGVRGRVVSVDI